MSRGTVLRFLVLAALLASVAALPASPAFADGGNVLANPSFEMGMHRTSLSSWVSDGWNPWFIHGAVSPSLGREPEFAVRNRPKEAHNGTWSMAWFNSYGTHNGGIYQTVAAPKGAVATFSLWMVGHSSKNDTDIFGPSTSVYQKWVGIDPYGGTNPQGPNVIWTGPEVTTDKWVQMVVTATVQGDAVTVFARGEPFFPVKNNAVVVDDASLTFSAAPAGAAPPAPPADTAGIPGLEGDQTTFVETGHTVAGTWLDWFNNHGGADVLGLPRSDVIKDPLQKWYSQYFQRAVLDWKTNPDGAPVIERRLLGDLLYPDNDPPLTEDQAPADDYEFFPFDKDKKTGLGHFVANYTADGQWTGFLDFFRHYGGVETFGYPKEEPKLRAGVWTQRFQAATFEYHPENDIDGFVPGTEVPYRDFAVMLDLLGDRYAAANKIDLK
ncbi:MAG: hypothetical protein M1370_05465 [Bacteroidetes bacterium]|nr:hypothetical protein [Bacteroidota bacterium]MCL5026053.1 hypothetical protein [Chloroflexota bacterium]